MTFAKASRPAILGGRPAVTISQTEANRWPIVTPDDERVVLDVLRSGDWSSHKVARDLESEFQDRFGVRHALAHCNGTAALLAAFFAIELQPGDEVIVPSATFWASVLPMLWLGAVPVFAESEFDRLGLDPLDVEARITTRTKAIVVVHLWGMPSKMTELKKIATRHRLKIVEDASHAAGALWRSRHCGTLGDVAVISLQTNKLVPAGEGGMFLTNSDKIFERSLLLGDMLRVMELDTPIRRFAATTYGVKTRIASMSAALARSQLRHLGERNTRRNSNLAYLSHQLERLGLQTFLAPPHIDRVYFEYIVRCDFAAMGIDAGLLVKALRAEGCDVSFPRYPLLHQQPFFTEGKWSEVARLPVTTTCYAPHALPKTEFANTQLLRLPAFALADTPLLDQYAHAFEKVFLHAKEISEDSVAAREAMA